MKKRIYICCKNEKWEKYKEQADSIYEGMVEVVEKKQDMQLMLVIQPICQEMDEDIKWAIEHKIPAVSLTNRFIPVRLYEAILNNEEFL